MKTFNIYKKRDGQDWNNVGDIYASDFDEACKKFAKQMTDYNHELSNNIQWLDKDQDGVNETGWYDFNGGSAAYNEDTEKYDADEAADFLLVSEQSINEGFSKWNEDVWTWEIRENLEYEEIIDMEDFKNTKDDYKYFMAFENERFFLYNGDFQDIAEVESLGFYNDKDDRFMGCPVDETETVELYFN